MQYLVLMVLHDVNRLNEILTAWEEAGTSGVTVLATTGLGRIRQKMGLREDLPLIPSIHDLLIDPNQEVLNRTIFSLVDSDELADKLVAATESVLGDLDNPRNGIMAVIPARVYGIDHSWKEKK